MNLNRSPGIISHKAVDPESLTFSVFTSEDIKELSVTKISSPLTFDSLGHPLLGGLYDSRLGPISDKAGNCGTCSRMFSSCPGHFGHIELPLPVVNPLFHKTIRTLLSYSCLECHAIQLDPTTKYLLQLKLQLVGAGLLTDALDIDSVVGIVNKKSQEKTSDTSLPDYQNNKRLKKYVKKLKEQNAHLETFLPRNAHRFREKFIKETMVTKTFKNCMYCQKPIPKITAVGDKLMKTVTGDGKSKKNATLLPDETKNHLQEIWTKNASLIQEIIPVLKNVKLDYPTDVFYLDVIAVPPPCIRPCALLRDQLLEHPQTAIYKTIMKTSFIARAIMKTMQITHKELTDDNSLLSSEAKVAVDYAVGETSSEKLANIWQELQTAVDHLLNGNEKGAERGLKQVIEKKEGVIRLHMMGKRVNFAARSVITPDPNLNLDEIGVPEAFAMKLTYPVPVTAWNVDMLRKMVMNGPSKHPGAVLIEHEDGRVINIPAQDAKKRESLAMRLLTPDERKTTGVKTVHRHLLNGDVLLLNRQPTLHKPSIMAHKARILKGEKTLRLHYANCKAYNADFDGDEMNAHFPQNEIARSEAYNIMDVNKQYLVPKDGTPLSGLIQDHVISGVKLSIRGKFFSKSDYQNLVYQGLSHLKKKLKLLPPTIIKPVQLWSGKQILSTLIINLIPEGKSPITLIGTAKIGSKNWESEKSKFWRAGGTPFLNANCMSESEVIIRNGELLCGVLDKAHYGSTPYSLAHCMYELYGSSVSGKFLSSLAKLFTYHLQLEGFTLGVKDILVIPTANHERSMIIKSCRQIGDATSADAVGISVDSTTDEIYEALENEYSKNPNFRAILDRKYKSELDNYTNNINKTCLPLGLVSKFPDNNLQLMVQSGAKGSTVNTMQISCLLGQIELEGKRPPLMISGKSLPSFRAYDTSPRAGGFIDGRFMTGIQPQEFFFHCMAGREGLIDTAVKTSKSGYLQRCLIKHLEGLKVEYDMTVRDSDNSIIQFAYGEDGMDVSKAQFINKKQVHFLDQNVNAIIDKDDLKKLKEDYNAKIIEKHSKQVKKYLKKQYVFGKRKRISSFTNYSEQFVPNHQSTKVEQIPGRTELTSRILSSWYSLDSSIKKEYAVKVCPDPLVTMFQPDHYFGVVNENIEKLMESYLKERENMSNTESYLSSTEAEFKDMMRLKYMQSLVAPGEPVGLLAAQSIGEPSTQMTLNTFHFAGRGDMNVTLGIPRLREILMTASANLKTPSMDIPFYMSDNVEKNAEKLQKTLSRVTIEDVLHKIDVSSRIKLVPTREMNYILKFHFLPYKMYKKKYNINPQQIVHYMENKFFAHMFKTIMKAAGKKSGFAISSKDKADKDKTDEKEDDDDYSTPATKVKKGVFNEEIDSSDEEEAADDDDNTQVKSRKRHTECQEYEDPESEEEEHSDVDEQSVTKNNISEDEGFGESDSDIHSSNVVKQYGQATNYTYDKVNYSWCQLNFKLPLKVSSVNLSAVLKSVAAQCVVREVPLIKRAITYTNNSNELILKTEGININEMFRFRNLLDLNRLYSNDIHAIVRTYGIEAGCKVIIKEIQNVFNVYGIKVDFRHLSLIADYMTYNGIFEPMSRRGMESSVSPLQQMSFESSLTFLKDATIKGKTDMLKSASSCLMIGQPCKTGTGSFSLFNTFK